MTVKIYLANLGKYNEGILKGEWFTLPMDKEDMFVQIGVGHYDAEGEFHHGVVEVERGVPYYYEEWAIHDYEAPFKISEWDSLDELNAIAELLGDPQKGIDFKILLDCCSTTDEAIEALKSEDYSIREFTSDSDYGQEMAEDTGLFNDNTKADLERFFDFEEYGKSWYEYEPNMYKVHTDEGSYIVRVK